MSLYRATSGNCIEFIESNQLWYQIYSSQQVRELCPFDLNCYWILYRWKISMVIIAICQLHNMRDANL